MAHQCLEKQFPCFDCKQPICADCVVIDRETLRCDKCDARVKSIGKKKVVQLKPKSPFKLGAAACFFTFIALSTLNMMAFCLT